MTLDSLPDDTIDESKRERDLAVSEDRDGNPVVIIDTEWHQEMDAKTYMEVFNSLVNKHRKLLRQTQQVQSQIQNILDNSEDEMELLHALDQSQEQDTENRRLKSDSLSPGTVQNYVKLQQLQNQKENAQEQMDDIYEDIEDMDPIAEKLVEEHDELEMPNNLELVKDEVEG